MILLGGWLSLAILSSRAANVLAETDAATPAACSCADEGPLDVSGVVYDARAGEATGVMDLTHGRPPAVVGALVRLEPSGVSTRTDSDGRFSLSVKTKRVQTLVITATGFGKWEAPGFDLTRPWHFGVMLHTRPIYARTATDVIGHPCRHHRSRGKDRDHRTAP